MVTSIFILLCGAIGAAIQVHFFNGYVLGLIVGLVIGVILRFLPRIFGELAEGIVDVLN